MSSSGVVFQVVTSCFYFEVWRHPYVPLKFPDCVIVCSTLMCFTCVWLSSLPLRPPFCLFQMVCHFHQHSSLLCFPEWFPVCLFYTWASRIVPAGPLYLCCASWLPGFDFCFIKWLCISMTVWFLLCVLRPVLDSDECLQNLILLEEVDSWGFKCQLLSEE